MVMVVGFLARRGLLFSAFLAGCDAHRTAVEGQGVLTSNAPVETFPKELEAKGYGFERKLACGMHGCAFLAKQGKTNVVVIKVSDENASEDAEERLLSTECGQMKWLRYEACRLGPKMLALHERYIPGCIEVGKLGNGLSFLVMPYAGPMTIKKLQKDLFPSAEHVANDNKRFSDSELKSLYAQLVAAVSSLHMMGIWHADLNSGNVMLDYYGNLALVDYGLIVRNTSTDQRSLDGYSRDANSVFRWGSVMARCPKEAQWTGKWWRTVKFPAFTNAQQAAEKCLKERWGVDEQFLVAWRKMLAASNDHAEGNQHVEGLLATTFVQKHLPKPQAIYRSDDTKECTTWTAAKLAQEMNANGAEEPFAVIPETTPLDN